MEGLQAGCLGHVQSEGTNQSDAIGSARVPQEIISVAHQTQNININQNERASTVVSMKGAVRGN